MKKKLSIILILIFVISLFSISVFAEDEDYQEFGPEFEKKVKEIEKMAKKLQKLTEKFEKMELDIIKREKMQVTDQNGNGVPCLFEIYYDSGYVIKFNTKADGSYSGDFNHFKNYPGQVISVEMSGCPCKLKKIDHKVTFPEFSETFERIKVIISDELSDKASDEAKKAAKKLVEKGFASAGASKLAGPFLWGFEQGAELGKPFGEALTKGLNNILDITRKANKNYRDTFSGIQKGNVMYDEKLQPANNRRTTARLWNLWRTKPLLGNNWNVDVVCKDTYSTISDQTFVDPRDYMDKPQITPPTEPTIPEDGVGSREEQEAEDEYWKEYERKRKQRERDEEARIKKEQEEAKKRWEEDKKKFEEKVKTVGEECPPCDPIRKLISETQDAILDKEKEIPTLEGKIKGAQEKSDKAAKKSKRAKDKLDKFDNPTSSASSEGRTVTSTDIAIDRMAAKNAWSSYMNGDLTANELADKWEKYDDDEREQAKKDYKAKLEKDIADSSKEAEDAQAELDAAESAVGKAKQQIVSWKKSLEGLEKELDDCIKLCKKHARYIAQGRVTTYDGLKDLDKPKVSLPPATVPTKPVEDDTSTGPCKSDQWLNDDDCANSCSANEECEWYKTVGDEDMCYGCTVECAEGEYFDSEQACGDDCDGDCTRGFRTKCWSCGEATVREEGPKSCGEYCVAQFGSSYSDSRPDFKDFILGELSGHECKKTVSITYPGALSVGECTCYKTNQPSVSVSGALYCEDTSCGDVACGASTSCSCGDSCTVTVTCNWAGWDWVGDAITGHPEPQLSAASE